MAAVAVVLTAQAPAVGAEMSAYDIVKKA